MSNLTTAFVVKFTPRLVNSRSPNPAWDGNMPLSPLDSAPVLSVVGKTSAMVCNNIEASRLVVIVIVIAINY